MIAFTQELKQKATDAGFVSVGVSNPDMLRDLPHGRIHSRYNLLSPEEHLPDVKSVILMAFHPWDKAFDLQVDSTNLQGPGMYSNQRQAESYQLYYEVMKSKAWTIADYLEKRGFESLLSLDIPLKTSAVRCGLGCQGKNTLLITPGYGPRVRLISVLTKAELDTDEPYKEDLCGNCERCVIACPTKALEPYKLRINRCMTYSVENPLALDVPEDVKKEEKRLIQRPTSCSYIECIMCIQACPIGKIDFQQTQ